nr:uncharacterized protein LOC119713298 isoform X2 [Anas platyrhynchos]
MDPLGAGSTRGHPPATQGWGWGSEKPDKNQIQVTFRLELCPRGPQPLAAAAPGAASPVGAKSRWRLVVVHSLCFNESLGAEAQLPRPGAQEMFVIMGTRPCLTVPSPLTNPGAELAPRSSSAEEGRAWRASWFTGTGRAESCSSSPGQSPFSFQSRASSPRLGSQVPGALSTAPASLLARSRAPRAPLCQQPPGANFSSKIPQGKMPQAESAADQGGLGRGHPSQAGNSSCCRKVPPCRGQAEAASTCCSGGGGGVKIRELVPGVSGFEAVVGPAERCPFSGPRLVRWKQEVPVGLGGGLLKPHPGGAGPRRLRAAALLLPPRRGAKGGGAQLPLCWCFPGERLDPKEVPGGGGVGTAAECSRTNSAVPGALWDGSCLLLLGPGWAGGEGEEGNGAGSSWSRAGLQLTLRGPFLCSPVAPLLPSHLPAHPSLSVQPILSQINLKSLYLKQDLACCLVSWVGAHTLRHRSLPVRTGHRGARPGRGAAEALGAPAGSCTRCAWTARSDMPQLVILS